MERGYVNLWRCSLDSRVFGNDGLWKVWTWCLMKASHQDRWVPIVTGKGKTEIEIKTGQFIFGRKTAAKELLMTESTIRNRIEKLKSIGNISLKPDTHYTVITICNWEIYQPREKQKGQPKDNQRTTKGQPKDTDKNVNNVNNVILRPDFVSEKTWKDLLEHRRNKKAKNTEKAISILIGQLKEAVDMKYTPEQCIDEMINRNWTGFKAEWLANSKVKPYDDGFY